MTTPTEPPPPWFQEIDPEQEPITPPPAKPVRATRKPRIRGVGERSTDVIGQEGLGTTVAAVAEQVSSIEKSMTQQFQALAMAGVGSRGRRKYATASDETPQSATIFTRPVYRVVTLTCANRTIV